MAIVSCRGGIKHVMFKVEGMDMDADVINGDVTSVRQEHFDESNATTK